MKVNVYCTDELRFEVCCRNELSGAVLLRGTYAAGDLDVRRLRSLLSKVCFVEEHRIVLINEAHMLTNMDVFRVHVEQMIPGTPWFPSTSGPGQVAPEHEC